MLQGVTNTLDVLKFIKAFKTSDVISLSNKHIRCIEIFVHKYIKEELERVTNTLDVLKSVWSNAVVINTRRVTNTLDVLKSKGIVIFSVYTTE